MTDFSNLPQDTRRRLLYSEIIRVLRLLGGQATRSQIREELKNSSKFISVETITEVKASEKNPGETFRPFDFPFYTGIKDLVFAGYLKDVDKHTVALTDRGRIVDTDSWDAKRDVFDAARPVWQKIAKAHKQAEKEKQTLSTEIVRAPVSRNRQDFEDEIENPETEFVTELHDALMSLTPLKFEEFARQLVRHMGVTTDPVLGIKASGDGGIDGFGYVTGDDFRTTRVAIQAKRWQGNISSPEIDQFRGAMDKFNAEYGIFITTSDFTKDAINASRSYTRMVTLINGEKIAELVQRYKLHVTPVTTWKLDPEFFGSDTTE